MKLTKYMPAVLILLAVTFLAFSQSEGKAAEFSRTPGQLPGSPLIQMAQDPYGGGGPVGDYNSPKVKTPEEQRQEHLQQAKRYEDRAEKQIEKGQKKADGYRSEAVEIMAQAQAEAKANPGDHERILEKARQKAERLEKKAVDALKKSAQKAEKYTTKAEEYYKKAEDT